MAAAKEALTQAVLLPLRHPASFAAAPLRLRSGALLHGPPGCGKTLLARAVAAESGLPPLSWPSARPTSFCHGRRELRLLGLPFISVSGPELLDKYIGASEAKVRDTFAKASAAAPCLLFFDEFEALGRARGCDSTGETDRVVSTLELVISAITNSSMDSF